MGKYGIKTPTEYLEVMVLDVIVATMRMPIFVLGNIETVFEEDMRYEVILCINSRSEDYITRTRELMRHVIKNYNAIVKTLAGLDWHASAIMTGPNIKKMLEDGFIEMLARGEAIIIADDYFDEEYTGGSVEIYPLPPMTGVPPINVTF